MNGQFICQSDTKNQSHITELKQQLLGWIGAYKSWMMGQH